MNILDRIVFDKKEAVAAAKAREPEAALRRRAEHRKEFRPFMARMETLSRGKVNIIAEIKRASPSKGDIRIDLDPAVLARQYEKGGAAALSVLTDTRYFKGSVADLAAARSAVLLPVLRKDFIVSAYQLYETAVMGADAALLIVRILEKQALADYLSLCRELGLGVLVETHSEGEIDTAIATGARLVGINNRNLGTFKTDVETSARLAGRMGNAAFAVAESGIQSRNDIERLKSAGIHRFLVGESLVRADSPASFLKSLVEGPPENASGGAFGGYDG